MLLKAMTYLGVKHVSLAGFDGYSETGDNYLKANMEYDFVRKRVSYLNEYTINFLKKWSKKITVNFLTDSIYKQFKQ